MAARESRPALISPRSLGSKALIATTPPPNGHKIDLTDEGKVVELF
jgi:hypothetical protein